jgi:hypothetical protein
MGLLELYTNDWKRSENNRQVKIVGYVRSIQGVIKLAKGILFKENVTAAGRKFSVPENFKVRIAALSHCQTNCQARLIPKISGDNLCSIHAVMNLRVP